MWVFVCRCMWVFVCECVCVRVMACVCVCVCVLRAHIFRQCVPLGVLPLQPRTPCRVPPQTHAKPSHLTPERTANPLRENSSTKLLSETFTTALPVPGARPVPCPRTTGRQPLLQPLGPLHQVTNFMPLPASHELDHDRLLHVIKHFGRVALTVRTTFFYNVTLLHLLGHHGPQHPGHATGHHGPVLDSARATLLTFRVSTFGMSTLSVSTFALDSDVAKPIEFEGSIIKGTSRKIGFEVLSTIITFDCQNDVELAKRILGAWTSFYKFKPVLVCKLIPLAKRFEVLARATHPSFLWCAGSWNLRSNQLSQVRHVLRSMARNMLYFKFQTDEDMDSFTRRTEASISYNLRHHNVIPFDELVHRAVLRWAGKLVQIQLDSLERLTSFIFRHRDWAWIQTTASQNRGRQLHGRYLREWRWERPMYKCFGDSRKRLAQDASERASFEEQLIAWRNLHR